MVNKTQGTFFFFLDAGTVGGIFFNQNAIHLEPL